MTATLDISKLRQLHEQATQGPWQSAADNSNYLTGGDGFLVAEASVGSTRGWKEKKANAALIAYVRTHLPEILERLSRT